jgi:hypothetical protein
LTITPPQAFFGNSSIGYRVAKTEFPLLSGQYIRDDPSAHIRQTKIAALRSVGQSFMIDPEDVQHGGVQIMDFDRRCDGVIAEVVCFAVRMASFYAAAGEPVGKVISVVVTPDVGVNHTLAERGSSELAAPND